MSKIYTKLALGILGSVALAQGPTLCSERKQDRSYCNDARCWFYTDECKEHKIKTAQAAIIVQPPLPLRRCLSDVHKYMPKGMKCLSEKCRIVKGSPCLAPLDTDYAG